MFPTLWTHTGASSLKVSSHGTSLKWSRGPHPSLHKNSQKLYDEKRHPLFSLKEDQWKWRQQHDQNFSNGAKATVEQILTLEERREILWESQWGILVGKLTIRVRSFEIITKLKQSYIKNCNRVRQVYQFLQNRLASSYDGDQRLQKQKHYQMAWLREPLRWKSVKKRAQRRRWS